MNTDEITWVSGWASDFSVWEDRIYEQFPSYSHRFIDYFDLLPEPDAFWDKNPRVADSGTVVGWSMGTLALLRNLHKKNSEQKWILLCPIANFCVKGCWQIAVVRATRQGILENTEKTLMSFSALMGDTQDMEKWVENALRYSPNQLAAGLDYLQKTSAKPCEAQNVELVFGEKDKVVPIAQKELFSELFPKFSVRVVENTGHWVFNIMSKCMAGATHTEWRHITPPARTSQ